MMNRKIGLTGRLDMIFDQNNDINPITNALLAIGEAISRQTIIIAHAATSQEQVEHSNSLDDLYQYQYLDGIIEEEIYIIEDLLAIACVICQTDIAYVITRAKKLIEYIEKEHAYKSSLLSTKANLMKLDPFVINESATAVQVINAYANYFKHKDEWADSWSNIMKSKDTQTKGTVLILVATGATAHSPYNFRNISKELGNTDFYRVGKFIDILDNWRKTIRGTIEIELRSRGVIE